MTDDREPYGRLVHQTRLDREAERAAAEGRQRFNMPPWEGRTEDQRGLDNRIASVIAEVVRAEVRGRFGHALREHYLAGISWDRARHEDNPVCACSRVFLGWHPSVGEAVEAWIVHVMDVAGSEENEPASPVAADPASPEIDGEVEKVPDFMTDFIPAADPAPPEMPGQLPLPGVAP